MIGPKFYAAMMSCLALSACGGGGTTDDMMMDPQDIDPADVVTTSTRGFAVTGETLETVPDGTVWTTEVRRIVGVNSFASQTATITSDSPTDPAPGAQRDLRVVTSDVDTTIFDGTNQFGGNASLSLFDALDDVGAFRIIFTDPMDQQILDYGVYGTSSDPVEVRSRTGQASYTTTAFMTMRTTDASGANVTTSSDANGIANVVLTADFSAETIGGEMTFTAANGPEADSLRGALLDLNGDLSTGNIFDGIVSLPAGGSGTDVDAVSGTFDGIFYGPDGRAVGGMMQGTIGTSANDNTTTFIGAFTGEE